MLQQELVLAYESGTICLFIIFLDKKGPKVTTITTYLSAVGYVHKILGLSDPTQQSIVRQTLGGLQKRGKEGDVRCPVTLPMLARLTKAKQGVPWPAFDQVAIEAIMVFAYGLFRLGELLSDRPGIEDRVMQLHNVTFKGEGLEIRAATFKRINDHVWFIANKRLQIQ